MDQDQEHNERMGNQCSRSCADRRKSGKGINCNTGTVLQKIYDGCSRKNVRNKTTRKVTFRNLLPSLRLKKGDVSSAVDGHMLLVREGARVHVDSVTVEDICAREPCK